MAIKVAFSHCTAKSQSVCSVTFSNVSDAVIVCLAYFNVDYLTHPRSVKYKRSGKKKIPIRGCCESHLEKVRIHWWI